MINLKQVRKNRFGNKGFTLIEILIVVMVLGILAMVIIPQITVSTTDAKESTLQTNLVAMRNAIELYYHQHNNVYPGDHKRADGADGADATEAPLAFVEQLTKYTEASGKVSATKTADAKYGPYLKSATLPANPFSATTALSTTVICDITETDITVKAQSGSGGWKFYVITGILLANDGGTGHAAL